MDLDGTKSVDEYKFKVACAILCQSHPEETAKLFFKLYDVDKDGAINEKDLTVFTRSLLCGLAYYDEEPAPTPKVVAEKVKSLMKKWNIQSPDDNKLTLAEWQ